jgi:uncharacterized protein
MKVLITGATGFIGKRVVKQLLAGGDEVVILSRNIAKAALSMGNKCEYVQWLETTETPPPQEAFTGVDGIINLMGEGIAEKRWDNEQKKKIYDSRILGTSNLIEGMKNLEQKPKVLVSASAVGIYGDRGSEEITEDSSLGNDFLAGVCKDWEVESQKARELGLRVANIRTGVVLGRGGGALQKMLPIFKLGAGGALGSGDQFMSWIHVDDLASMYVEALKNDLVDGPYNGTAPYPATNRDFTKLLGKTLKRPTFATAPAFALKFVFGEMSSVLLEGQKVIPMKFKQVDFRYKYPTLEMALKETAF